MELPKAPCRALSRGRARSGSLIVEAVIAAALLATAMFAVARLAKSSAALDHQADQRLAAALTAENTIARLRAVDAADLLQEAESIADAMTDASGCEVEILAEKFKSDDNEGVHLRVDVVPTSAVKITLHDWRLLPRDPPSEGDDA